MPLLITTGYYSQGAYTHSNPNHNKEVEHVSVISSAHGPRSRSDINPTQFNEINDPLNILDRPPGHGHTGKDTHLFGGTSQATCHIPTGKTIILVVMFSLKKNNKK